MTVAKEIEIYFPALHEFRKHGSLVDQMLDKGFDGAKVHYYHKAFGLGELRAPMPFARNEALERMLLYDRLKSEEELFIILNHTRHYNR